MAETASDFECPICCEMVDEALQLPCCESVICEHCLDKSWKTGENSLCPLCRKRITRSFMRSCIKLSKSDLARHSKKRGHYETESAKIISEAGEIRQEYQRLVRLRSEEKSRLEEDEEIAFMGWVGDNGDILAEHARAEHRRKTTEMDEALAKTLHEESNRPSVAATITPILVRKPDKKPVLTALKPQQLAKIGSQSTIETWFTRIKPPPSSSSSSKSHII